MIKIRKGSVIYEIDCDNEMCGNCSHKPIMSEQKCKLFDVLIDHISSGSGWKRCLECINAEEN